MTQIRRIIEIDEEKCNGCGNCIPSCAEGALALVDGKARIVKDIYCDGLGACLGHCPQDALRIIERPAEAFDEAAAMAHAHSAPSVAAPLGCGCPGHHLQEFQPAAPAAAGQASQLSHWPVKLRLVPAQAPFLRGAHLLLAADCAAAAAPDFHAALLAGRKVVMGCPKFDDVADYVERLAAIIRQARPASLTVARMEVPCCAGMTTLAQQAVARSGVNLPVTEVIVDRQGQLQSRNPAPQAPEKALGLAPLAAGCACGH